MAGHSDLTKRLIREGLAPHRAFGDYPPPVQAAVNAYDEARRKAFGRTNEPAMSDANKANIAPMILAAVLAYSQAQERAA